MKKLEEELEAALPDPKVLPTSAKVEKLPYLSAVIQEGLRLHPGSTQRMQRISPDASMVYHDRSTKEDWVIPVGTPVSMDPMSIQMNPDIFPDPQAFTPER